jgi:hypothetical protein
MHGRPQCCPPSARQRWQRRPSRAGRKSSPKVRFLTLGFPSAVRLNQNTPSLANYDRRYRPSLSIRFGRTIHPIDRSTRHNAVLRAMLKHCTLTSTRPQSSGFLAHTFGTKEGGNAPARFIEEGGNCRTTVEVISYSPLHIHPLHPTRA